MAFPANRFAHRYAGGIGAALVVLLVAAGCGGSRAYLPNNDDGWPVETWTTSAYNAQRTRRTPYSGPDTARLAWTVAFDTYTSGPSAVGPDGTIYCGTGESFSAFSPAGELLWLLPLDRPAVSKPVLDAAGNIYVRVMSSAPDEADRRDALLAIGPDGRLLWRWEAESALFAGPTLDPSQQLVLLTPARVVALKLSGEVAWSQTLNARPQALAAGTEGQLYLSLAGEELLALNANGAELWRRNIYRVYGANLAPAPDGGVLLGIRATTGDTAWRVYSYGPTGDLRWTSERLTNLDQGPVASVDGRLYVQGGFGELYALDHQGRLLWTFVAHGRQAHPPVVGPDGMIYLSQVGPDNDQVTGVLAVNPDGTQRYFRQHSSPHSISFAPTLGPAGRLLVPSYDRLQALAPDGSLAWEHIHTGQIVGAPVLGQDGQLYLATSRHLLTLDREGRENWRYRGEFNFIAPPCLTRNTSGVQSITCLMYSGVLSLDTAGHLAWEVALPGWNGVVPAQAADGLLYLAGSDEIMYALHPNGSLNWSKPVPGIAGASASLTPDGTVLLASDKLFYSVNPSSTFNWWLQFDAAITSQVAVADDGTAYIASTNGKLYAVLPSGLIWWIYECPSGIPRPPAIGADGTLVVGTTDLDGLDAAGQGTVFALTPQGELRWTFAGTGFSASSAVIDSRGRSFCTIDNTLYAIDAQGQELWRGITQQILGAPVLGENGRVFVSGGSELYCFAP